jgi:TolB protein
VGQPPCFSVLQCWRKIVVATAVNIPMKKKNIAPVAALVLITMPLIVPGICAQSEATLPIGIFENHVDVGTVLHPGTAEYDPSSGSYTLAASGENIWAGDDHFQFVWKKMSGDVALSADIALVGQGGNPHRKAVVMFRQDLDPNSIYADIALHGVGTSALQYRNVKGEVTHEIGSNILMAKRLRIVKRGDHVYMSLAKAAGDDPQFAGGWIKIPLQGTFYVGIGLCSHDKDVVEKAIFSKVTLQTLSPSVATAKPKMYSTLETVAISSSVRQVAYIEAGRFKAPNWTFDGASFIFNKIDRVEKIPIAGGSSQVIDTGLVKHPTADHGVSPDGKWLAVTEEAPTGGNGTQIYIIPFEGGSPRRVTANSPSFWHGWSPDGKTLVFVGQRNDNHDAVYTIPSAGGEETRLTTDKSIDDTPEYSPDGNYIYFNSDRTGRSQIWRMKPDGSNQEQVFADDYSNWFPHISPDGKWMVFLSYDGSVSGHPKDKDVMLRLMSLSDKSIKVLAKLVGGQGTINAPSWSPDSTKLAFVSYALIPEESPQQ